MFISTVIIFILLTLTMFISNTVIIFLSKHGFMIGPPERSLMPFLVQTGIISILTGTILTLCIGHLPLRPINTLIQAIHAVSQGNFQTKINLERPQEFRELSRCFNQMTEELAGMEILRSDFINNFSHEFKTPIVSILGFARLLKKGISPAKSKIYLSLENDGELVKITIKDYGIGMDEKTQHNIFDRFYQGDNSRSLEGNGLGLPLVKKIIELHHGTITVTSHPGEGSAFIVTLPSSTGFKY